MIYPEKPENHSDVTSERLNGSSGFRPFLQGELSKIPRVLPVGLHIKIIIKRSIIVKLDRQAYHSLALAKDGSDTDYSGYYFGTAFFTTRQVTVNGSKVYLMALPRTCCFVTAGPVPPSEQFDRFMV